MWLYWERLQGVQESRRVGGVVGHGKKVLRCGIVANDSRQPGAAAKNEPTKESFARGAGSFVPRKSLVAATPTVTRRTKPRRSSSATMATTRIIVKLDWKAPGQEVGNFGEANLSRTRQNQLASLCFCSIFSLRTTPTWSAYACLLLEVIKNFVTYTRHLPTSQSKIPKIKNKHIYYYHQYNRNNSSSSSSSSSKVSKNWPRGSRRIQYPVCCVLVCSQSAVDVWYGVCPLELGLLQSRGLREGRDTSFRFWFIGICLFRYLTTVSTSPLFSFYIYLHSFSHPTLTSMKRSLLWSTVHLRREGYTVTDDKYECLQPWRTCAGK